MKKRIIAAVLAGMLIVSAGDVEMGQLHQGMLWIIRMEWRRKVLRVKP